MDDRHAKPRVDRRALAAVEYLADLGRLVTANESLSRRAALREAYREIGLYERSLVKRLLAGLADMPDVQICGITDPDRLDERVADRFASRTSGSRLPKWPGGWADKGCSSGTATTTP